MKQEKVYQRYPCHHQDQDPLSTVDKGELTDTIKVGVVLGKIQGMFQGDHPSEMNERIEFGIPPHLFILFIKM